MNIYAPTQDLEKEQIKFYKELETDVEQHIDTRIIIGGDLTQA